jgi:hypothetical protein
MFAYTHCSFPRLSLWKQTVTFVRRLSTGGGGGRPGNVAAVLVEKPAPDGRVEHGTPRLSLVAESVPASTSCYVTVIG